MESQECGFANRIVCMPDHVTTSHPDDAEWVRTVLAEYERPLILYCAKFMGDADAARDAARDVVQDAFLRLIGAERETVEDHIAEWLFTVCRNRCLDVLKKEQRMTAMSDEKERTIAAPACASGEEQREHRGEVLALLEGLPARQQEVIRLKFLGGLSYKEISRVTELTVTNVGFLIHTGMKSIRETLGEIESADLDLAR